MLGEVWVVMYLSTSFCNSWLVYVATYCSTESLRAMNVTLRCESFCDGVGSLARKVHFSFSWVMSRALRTFSTFLTPVTHLSPEMLNQRRSLCLRCLKHWWTVMFTNDSGSQDFCGLEVRWEDQSSNSQATKRVDLICLWEIWRDSQGRTGNNKLSIYWHEV